MWVMTTFGFFSIVEYNTNPAYLLVRARVREHLEEAIVRYWPDLGLSVTESPRADYPFRVRVRRRDVSWMMKELVAELDYGNFKGEIETGPYSTFLHRVWAEGIQMSRENSLFREGPNRRKPLHLSWL